MASPRKEGPGLRLESDPAHHLTGPFLPQTPIGSKFNTPVRGLSPSSLRKKKNASHPPTPYAWLWLVDPVASLKLMILPVILWANWEFITPYFFPNLATFNPFEPMLFIQYPSAASPPDTVLYTKGYLDIVFVLYHIIVFSFIRVMITKISLPIARHYGIKKEAKLDRFGEQAYAMIYFAVMGAWGLQVMSQLPTWWYDTKHFWTGYPEWQLSHSMKRYYLTHIAYWFQQFLVMVLKLEKPRKDYQELVIHHFVTLWLILWSYLMNLTLIGNAIYVSMDLPDTVLALSKLLNYMRFERAKVVTFAALVVVWTYFRHYLNLKILWSCYTEFELIPETARVWKPENGTWMPLWVQYQLFIGIGALQILNLFWYFLIMRILVRTILTAETTDERSDDEDDDDDDDEDTPENKKSQ